MKDLRHVVLFRFFDVCTPAEIKACEQRFNELAPKLPGLKGYEWGINNSPEKISKGFTHCYFLTFGNEADRNNYINNNEDHKEFKLFLTLYLDAALVVDYWANS